MPAHARGRGFVYPHFLQPSSTGEHPSDAPSSKSELTMKSEVTIKEEFWVVFQQLLEANDDDAVGTLAQRLRQLQHQLIQDARGQVGILSSLDTAPKSKTGI